MSHLLVSLPPLWGTAHFCLTRRSSNASRLVWNCCGSCGDSSDWSGPTPACACPQSPQLPELDCFLLWEHSLSEQIFHRCRVYPANCRDLICSLCKWWKDFWSSSLVALPLGLNCGFIPTSPFGPPTEICSQGCPGALGSVPVRTGHRGGMAAWITGALVAPGVQGNQQPRAQEICS